VANGLTCVRGQMERLTHLLEDIAFGNAAYISRRSIAVHNAVNFALVEPHPRAPEVRTRRAPPSLAFS